MCVIIHKPKGVKLREEMIEKSWKGNPHGGGFILINEDNKAILGKGYMTYQEFLDIIYKDNLMSENIESILHFRIATHGGVNSANTHPFYDIEKNIALCHNGILTEFGSSTLSDTKDLFESVLCLVDANARSKVLNSLSGSDKFVLFNEGIIEKFGHWTEFEGCFYSNNYSLPYVPVQATKKVLDFEGTTSSSLKYCDECRLACLNGYREYEGYLLCDDCYVDWYRAMD